MAVRKGVGQAHPWHHVLGMRVPSFPSDPVDEAKVRAEVSRRDALRREAGLPRLDVEAEVARGLDVARRAARAAILDAHSADRERIRGEVLAEGRARLGPGFPNGWAGHMALGHEVARRFEAYLRGRYGDAAMS